MIITLAQVKSLLNISNTSKDTLISALIPEAEAKYLQIRNIPFLKIKASAVTGDKTLTDISLYPENSLISGIIGYNGTPAKFLNRMEHVFGGGIDNYISDIDTSANTIEIDTVSSADITDVIFTVYPQGSKMTAAKMIKYLMNQNSMSGLESESVGSYSWSAGSDGNPFGVPSDIYKSIKRYVNI